MLHILHAGRSSIYHRADGRTLPAPRRMLEYIPQTRYRGNPRTTAGNVSFLSYVFRSLRRCPRHLKRCFSRSYIFSSIWVNELSIGNTHPREPQKTKSPMDTLLFCTMKSAFAQHRLYLRGGAPPIVVLPLRALFSRIAPMASKSHTPSPGAWPSLYPRVINTTSSCPTLSVQSRDIFFHGFFQWRPKYIHFFGFASEGAVAYSINLH